MKVLGFSAVAMKRTTDRIQVFSGQVSDMSADLFLRLPGPTEHWKDVEVKGPYCSSARTLPTTARFEPLPDNSGLWRARIIDPVCWSLDHPMLYRVQIGAGAGDSASETTQIECGIRRFGCKDGNFWFDGKRWVLRGVWREHVRETDLAAWKQARIAMCVKGAETALFVQAARQGIMLVVDLEGAGESDDLVAVTQCPAVMLVIVSDDVDIEPLRGMLPNIVIAKRCNSAAIDQPPSDADAVLFHADDAPPTPLMAYGHRPVLASRSLPEPVDELTVARAACDLLQRDLAGRYDLSGYIV